MVNRIYNYMIRHAMTAPGTRVLAAVSGGADSMCLLEVLRELRSRAGIELRVLHVHHGLRETADRDLLHVSKYCEAAGIPFQAAHVDAGSYAAEKGLSVEEAARNLRYEVLEQTAADWDREQAAAGIARAQVDSAGSDPCRIAVAHHIEDQAETVLFNLVRGSRLTGLRGMQPVNGRIIRPMLELSRAEIEEFLAQRGIAWCEDETNEDIRYARNLLRREVMPLLTQINSGAKEHIARAAEEAAETEEFLAKETQRVLRACVGKPEEREVSLLKIKALLREPELLERRAVYEVIAAAAGGKKDVQDAHVQAVLRLARKQGNGELDLVSGVRVKKVYDWLYFYRGARKGKEAQDTAPDTRRWPAGADEYSCTLLSFSGDMASVPRKQYTKWFDYDKIGTLPVFRSRREGDQITLDESGKSKSIARYMIDEKIPRELRGKIVMPAVGSEILWVPAPDDTAAVTPAGLAAAASAGIAVMPAGRINDAFKVSPGTRTVLEIQWEPGTEISHTQTL